MASVHRRHSAQIATQPDPEEKPAKRLGSLQVIFGALAVTFLAGLGAGAWVKAKIQNEVSNSLGPIVKENARIKKVSKWNAKALWLLLQRDGRSAGIEAPPLIEE